MTGLLVVGAAKRLKSDRSRSSCSRDWIHLLASNRAIATSEMSSSSASLSWFNPRSFRLRSISSGVKRPAIARRAAKIWSSTRSEMSCAPQLRQVGIFRSGMWISYGWPSWVISERKSVASGKISRFPHSMQSQGKGRSFVAVGVRSDVMSAHNHDSRIVGIIRVITQKDSFQINCAIFDAHAEVIVKTKTHILGSSLHLLIDRAAIGHKLMHCFINTSHLLIGEVLLQPIGNVRLCFDIPIIFPIAQRIPITPQPLVGFFRQGHAALPLRSNYTRPAYSTSTPLPGVRSTSPPSSPFTSTIAPGSPAACFSKIASIAWTIATQLRSAARSL